MASLTYDAARDKVIEVVRALVKGRPVVTEAFSLTGRPTVALHRILAEDVAADRDYPPFNRAMRDGYALRSTDAAKLPRNLQVIGESKAGRGFAGEVGAGACVQIMTGAPVPAGADTVVMLEHVRRDGDAIFIEQPVQPGQNISPQGSEAQCGETVLRCGARLGYAELALAAQVGHASLRVHRRPRVAVLSTGDEVIAVDRRPGPFEIRNSNSVSLAAQVQLAGAEPVVLANAADRPAELKARLEQGLECDALLITGGVSAGKYDLVEEALKGFGAEFFFDAVEIRPGRPTVFGVCRGKPVFGLPGNPVSTMVTCELFAVPALDILSGAEPRPLSFLKAKLKRDVKRKAPLTHFVPAKLTRGAAGMEAEEVPWHGSGDIVGMARANCFLVVSPARLSVSAGEMVDVMLRRDLI